MIQDKGTPTTETTGEMAHDPEEFSAQVKAKQNAARRQAKAANGIPAKEEAPKAAPATKAGKVKEAIAKRKQAPKPKADKAPSKADAVRALLDKGKSVREVSDALADQGVSWSYAWDVARAYEDRLKAPGKFIPSRAPGAVKKAPATAKASAAPKAKATPKRTPAQTPAQQKRTFKAQQEDAKA